MIRKAMPALLLALVFGGLPACHFSLFGAHAQSNLQRAEELSRQGKYDEAIDAYHRHMNERLALKNRPEWENPYFYLILIGDIHLGRGQPLEALTSYQEADEKKVDQYLVADRIRSLAAWYEKEGRLKDAIGILTKYREKDPLMFDSMLDRLAKELVRREDNEKAGRP